MRAQSCVGTGILKCAEFGDGDMEAMEAKIPICEVPLSHRVPGMGRAQETQFKRSGSDVNHRWHDAVLLTLGKCPSSLSLCLPICKTGGMAAFGIMILWGALLDTCLASGRASLMIQASIISHCVSPLILLCSGRTRKVERYHKGVGQALARVSGAQGLNLHGNRHALFTWPNE